MNRDVLTLQQFRYFRRYVEWRWSEQLVASRDMLWSPTIRAALIAETPWHDVFCPCCGTSRAIDLRKVDRHPLASVATLVLELCPESAPMPRTLGLHALPPAAGEHAGQGLNWRSDAIGPQCAVPLQPELIRFH
jgi:hypothetical protein